MQSLLMLLKSKTFWTFVVTFAFNGLQALEPIVDPKYQVGINAVLVVLGAYFHINPSQSYHGSQLTTDNGQK